MNASREIKYDSNGLIPAIVQDAETNQVLMLAYIDVYKRQGCGTGFGRSL